jgi:hypothetical protein
MSADSLRRLSAEELLARAPGAGAVRAGARRGVRRQGARAASQSDTKDVRLPVNVRL